MGWRGAAIGVALASTGPAMAQSPIVITSEAEAGWTSNATDSAAGQADLYASHSQSVSLAGEAEAFVLRGSLSISQTRFLQTTFEDDDAVSGTVEAEMALGDEALLRLGYGVTRHWDGDDLAVGGVVVPIRSDGVDHAYVAELVVAGPEQQVTIGVNADWVVPGDTTLVGFGLAPVRLAAEVGSVAVRAKWERALTPTVAALAGMEARFTAISEMDQLTFQRAPADSGRIDAGLRLMEGDVSLEGSAGIDVVWPKGQAGLLETSPYFALAASLTPLPDLTLAFGAQTGVELADPLDGVAGRTTSIEARAAWLVRPNLTLSARIADFREVAIFDASLAQWRRAASLGASWAVSERLAYGVTLSWSRHVSPVESYDKAGIALSLSGAI
jgi:hypothetical protein